MVSNSAYGASAVEVAELFADYLEGDGTRPAFALSGRKIDDASRNAIDKSLESFGYAPQSCTYATLIPHNADEEGGDIPLDAQALFTLIEGLDPLLLIATDTVSRKALAHAFRVDLPEADAVPARIFGRPSAVFQDLTTLLKTETGKQKAWHVLKSLNV